MCYPLGLRLPRCLTAELPRHLFGRGPDSHTFQELFVDAYIEPSELTTRFMQSEHNILLKAYVFASTVGTGRSSHEQPSSPPNILSMWAAAGNLFPMQASMQHDSAARLLPREADTPRFGNGLLGLETSCQITRYLVLSRV